MPTHFTDSELEQLLDFVGYGTLDADVWFLGMEEAGGGEENLRKRLKFRIVEDCAEAHDILGIRKHHWGKKTIQRTWRGMCCIMLALEGKEITTEAIRNYQADSLGRFGGRTLLTELLPIPKPAISHWDYAELFPQYSSRENYYDTIRPRRIQYLQELIIKYQPKIIIGYGKTYWPGYKELFPTHQFKSIDQFEVAKNDQTTILLSDHFTARTMNGKFGNIANILKS